MMREMLEQLVKIDDYDWGRYAFMKDPLNGRVKDDKRDELIKGSIECGRLVAADLLRKYGKLSSGEYAKLFGINVRMEDARDDGSYIMFAKFNQPGKITVYKGAVDMAEELVRNEQLFDLIQKVKIEDVLIAHEMYHYLEIMHPETYTHSEKILLWSLGSIKYKSGLVALGEIGAMSFTKELLSLNYSPYVFDTILLYPFNKERAEGLYRGIMTLTAKDADIT